MELDSDETCKKSHDFKVTQKSQGMEKCEILRKKNLGRVMKLC